MAACPRQDTAAPSVQPHYRAFSPTTDSSVPVSCIGQLILIGSSDLDVSLRIKTTGSHVPCKSLSRSRAAFEPDDTRVSHPVVCPVKASVFSRRQTCRGKSQAPRSLDSRVARNQDSEAYRQGLPWGDYESPGRNNSERKCGLEKPDPRAEPASVGRRQDGVPKSDRCGISTLAG